MIQRILAIAALTLLLAGCAVDRTTGERTLKSAAAGAAGGAVAGLFYGNPLTKAAVGGAAGAAGGFVYDQLSR
ncbi:MAG TPA: YMGG-like glycine zipper-containing protein [Geminicoccaceae bacterium]